jgi:inositol transport system substrate-binding protein
VKAPRERRVLLALPEAKNPFMRATADAAARVALSLGIAVDTVFAEGDFTVQVHQLYDAMRQGSGLSLLMVMPVEERALRTVSEQALQAGIGWFWLSRSVDNVAELRQRFPELPISLITPDHVESGRIQARQLRALLPRGGRVLHVLGRMSNQSARLRAQGFEELVSGTEPAIEVLAKLDGNWSPVAARSAVSHWLSVMRPTRHPPDAVVCQNDAMAKGVVEALRTLALETGDSELAALPVIGVDGLREVGRLLVDDGTLTATTLLPMTSDVAVRAAAAYILHGEMPPQRIVLEPKPYPAPSLIRPRQPLARGERTVPVPGR